MLCELPLASLSAGERTLLENSGEAKNIGSLLRLKLGGRHLLLGENGCGKTTLLRAIQNRRIPGWPAGVSTCLVEQSLLQLEEDSSAVVASTAGRPPCARGQPACQARTIRGGPYWTESERQPSHLAASGQSGVAPALPITALDFLLNADVTRNHNLGRIADLESELATESLTQIKAAEVAVQLDQLWEQMEDEGQRKLRATRILTSLGFADEARLREDDTGDCRRAAVATTTTPVEHLSGGWKARLALASALFGDPQVLLLDEPTNHLDLASIRWLEEFLVERYNPQTKKTLVCVSHDRAFLNHVVTDLVVMHKRVLRFFHGDFDHFEEAAAQLEMRLERANAKNSQIQKQREKAMLVQQERDAKQKARHSSLIWEKRKYSPGQALLYGGQMSRKVTVLKEKNQRGGMERNLDGKAYKASRDGNRLLSDNSGADGALEAVLSAAPLTVLKDPNMVLRFPSEALAEHGSQVATFANVCFSYDGHNPDLPVIADANLTIEYGEKVAVVGENGTGKTTFLKLLLGAVQLPASSIFGVPASDAVPNSSASIADHVMHPTRGEVTRALGLRWSFVSQQESEALGNVRFARTTALEYFNRHFADWDLRNKDIIFTEALAAFGIKGGTATKQPLATLSAGQRVRVALARVAVEKPHLLILDEPSNHLDLYSVEAMTRGLREFPGAIVFASHNRQMVLDISTKIVRLEAGQKIQVVRNEAVSLQESAKGDDTDVAAQTDGEDKDILQNSNEDFVACPER